MQKLEKYLVLQEIMYGRCVSEILHVAVTPTGCVSKLI